MQADQDASSITISRSISGVVNLRTAK